MFNFFKKKTDADRNLNQLNEEEIQQKLYGSYKPGTLGKVITVHEEEQQDIIAAAETQPITDQPDLFSGIVDVEEDAESEVPLTVEIDQSAVSTLGVAKTASSFSADPVEEVSDDELFQLDFDDKEDNTLFDDFSAGDSSFKIWFMEVTDHLRAHGLKYALITIAILVGFVLAFNLISSYILSSTNNDANKKEESSIVSQVKSHPVQQPKKTEEASVNREVVSIPVIRVEADKKVVAGAGVETARETVTLTAVSPVRYTVQICASNDLMATKKLVADLTASGYTAFYRQASASQSRNLFFIFVGQFASRGEANDALKQYRNVPLLKRYGDSFVTNVKS